MDSKYNNNYNNRNRNSCHSNYRIRVLSKSYMTSMPNPKPVIVLVDHTFKLQKEASLVADLLNSCLDHSNLHDNRVHGKHLLNYYQGHRNKAGIYIVLSPTKLNLLTNNNGEQA